MSELWIPMVQANAICERACQELLAQHPGLIRRMLRFSIPFREFHVEDDGWVHVSNLTCDVERVYWRIQWDPERDEVQLDGPRR